MNTIPITTLSGEQTTVEEAAVNNLQAALRGELLRPGQAGYDQARAIWNGMVDRRPALIARCVGTHDVLQAVNFARDHNLLLAVKGGGHNVAGHAVCDGGLMIDLSLMRSAQVDPHRRSVRVDGGCLLGDVDVETQRYGLAISAGIISHTGVAGLTLGGGFGWISRKHGLTVDNLLAATIVTAGGQVLTASAEENPDLFWGLRGGGGNFGVVTSFTFRCAEIGTEVFSGLIVHSFENARAYLQFHRDYVRQLPDEMTIFVVIRRAPPLPFLPESVHGQLVAAVPFVYLGHPEEGKKLINPIRQFGRPHGEAIGMTPWVQWQSGFDPLNAHGARNYWKSHHLTGLPDACIDQILEFAAAFPSADCEIFIPHMEGAPARVPANATAYAHRSAPFLMNVHTRWSDPAGDERCLAWVRAFFESTQPFAQGVYVNFISDEGEARVKDAYSEEVWSRLAALKKKYDPDNLFRMNQNIKPAE